MEDGWEEIGKGNVPTKLREQHRVWLTTDAAKNVSFISQNKKKR